MERVIEIDITDKYQLVEKYNDKTVSKELIKYIIDEAMDTKKKDSVKIVISKKFQTSKSCKTLIIEGLKKEYDESLRLHHLIDMKQYFFLVWGIIALAIASKISDESMWKEVLLVGGWVPLWEMIDLEIFSDADERKKRKVLKKLLASEIVED